MTDTLYTEIDEEAYAESHQHDIIMEGTKVVLGIGFVLCVVIMVLCVIGIIKKLRK